MIVCGRRLENYIDVEELLIRVDLVAMVIWCTLDWVRRRWLVVAVVLEHRVQITLAFLTLRLVFLKLLEYLGCRW